MKLETRLFIIIIFFLILKEEGLTFNLKPISKQNSKNSIFGKFSKVGENTWAFIRVIIFILLLIRNQRLNNTKNCR